MKRLKNEDPIIDKMNNLDSKTIDHSTRMKEMVSIFIDKDYIKNRVFSDKEINSLKIGTFYHDIGKSFIDTSIYVKPKKLNGEEKITMNKHPILGYKFMKKNIDDEIILSIILEHHEKVDGSGYPYNKKNEEISYFSKIVAIIDSFDAMVSHRDYNSNNKNFDEAILEIERNKGKHFDEKLAEYFITFLKKEKEAICNIYNKYSLPFH